MFDPKKIQKYFPLTKKITYLDSAAGTLKPITMLKELTEYFYEYSISTRTAESKMADRLNSRIISLREKIARFVDAKPHEVIFTTGATESLNAIAQMTKKILHEGDEVLLSYNNHSSNIAPWYRLRDEIGIKVVISQNIVDDITNKTKVIAISQMSNNFDNNFKYERIAHFAKRKKIFLINDAAQAVSHEKVTLKDADAIALSGNKMFGPTGIGFLILKEKWANQFEPVKIGGGSILTLNEERYIFKDPPEKFEAGTPNFQNLVAMHAGIDFLERFINQEAHNYMDILENYLLLKMTFMRYQFAEIYQRGIIFLFNIYGYHAHDVASYLATKDINVRSGKFCAYLGFKNQPEQSVIRISLSYYTTPDDIDKLVAALDIKGDPIVI